MSSFPGAPPGWVLGRVAHPAGSAKRTGRRQQRSGSSMQEQQGAVREAGKGLGGGTTQKQSADGTWWPLGPNINNRSRRPWRRLTPWRTWLTLDSPPQVLELHPAANQNGKCFNLIVCGAIMRPGTSIYSCPQKKTEHTQHPVHKYIRVSVVVMLNL